MSGVVTGEAVFLDLPAATFASRAVSGAMDVFVGILLLVAGSIALSQLSSGLDAAAAAALGLVLTVAVLVGLPVLVETLTRGRTLGKLVMGLRVVRDDGGPIRFRHALGRGLVGFVEVYLTFGIAPLLSSLLSATGKRLGDLVAGTYVVRERGAVTSAPMSRMPPQLAGWARSADVARLPDGLALAVRQFLGRAPGLHTSSRQGLGVDLAAAVSPHVWPPPPQGTHPEAFLAAVLSERRRRDTERLAREQLVRQRLAGVDSIENNLARVKDVG